MTHSTHTVQTCVPAGDLFDGTPDAPPAPRLEQLLELEGVLLQDAEVRTQPVGDGTHTRPVLCLELASTSARDHRIRARQIFTEDARGSAVALAATLRKGMRVTLTTPDSGMCITLPHIARVAITKED